MRLINSIALFLFTSNFLYAQDTLFKEDGSKKIVKVLEVNETVIRYKLSDNPDGPTYVISIEDVKRVVYATGSTAVFYQKDNDPLPPEETPAKRWSRKSKTEKIKPPPKVDVRSTDFGRNFISVNALHFIVGDVTLCYEHTFKSGRLSLRSPLRIGLSSGSLPDYPTDQEYFEHYGSNYYNYIKFSVGLDVFKYPHGQGKSRYFFGPSLEYGQFNFYVPYSENLSYYQKEDVTYFTLLFQNGFLFQPSKHFNYSVNLGLGFFVTGNKEFFDYANTVLVLRGGVNIGYKF